MKYSVFHHHICEAARETGCTVPEMMRTARSWGITHIELDRDAIGSDTAAIRAFAALLAEGGLTPSSIYGFYSWQEEGSLPAADDLLLRQAELLNCPRVMIIPGFFTDPADADRCGTEKARMIAATRQFAAMAARRGITPTIECFDDARSPISTIAGMSEFLAAVPELRVTLETGNFLFSGDDILEAQYRFSDRIAHVHLKDRFLPRLAQGVTPAGTPTTAVTGEVMYPCAVGYGHIPMATVLRRLSGAGYEGVMTIEHFGAADYAGTIRASIQWLKEKEAAL
ncbi:MAG: sugar phosphate isomerase/epimerase [Clostridia bacterium]|nr:sugar phosphate isomerase/epimerase [Clostridia bacterium]